MVKKNVQIGHLSKISQRFIDKGRVKKSKHLLITGVCNNNCIFCFSEDLLKKSHKRLAQIKRDMEEGLKEGCEKIVLSGGEPTIHPDFLDVVKMAKDLGYESVQVITNGRMFSYQKFLREAVNNGLNEVSFSIHSNSPSTQDYLTGSSGSFKQSIEGLRNALREKISVQVKIVLNKQNIENLKESLDYFIGIGVKNFEILNLVPEGNAWKNRDKLFFEMEDYESTLYDSLIKFKKRDIVINLGRFNSPKLSKIINKKEEFNKKINELNIRKKDYFKLFKTKKILPCFGLKCSYCFIRQECINVQTFLINLKGRKALSDKYLQEVFKRELRRDSNEEFLDFILIDHSRKKVYRENYLNEKDIKKVLARLEKNWSNELISIDLLSLRSNKKLAKVEYIRKNLLIYIKNFCRRNSYFYRIEEESSKKGYYNIYISRDKLLAQNAKELEGRKDIQSRLKFGSLLGYPKCCINRFFRYEKNSESAIIKRFFIENNRKTGSFHFNRFSDFVLIGHLPHSLDCQYSLKMAEKSLKLLEEANHDTKEIIKLNQRIVIRFKDFLLFIGGYKERDIIYYKRAYGEFNENSFFRVLTPKSNDEIKKISLFYKEVIGRINEGNKIKIGDNCLEVYKGNSRMFTFLFPEEINYIIFK